MINHFLFMTNRAINKYEATVFAFLTSVKKKILILNLPESGVLPLCGASGYPAWLSFILE